MRGCVTKMAMCSIIFVRMASSNRHVLEHIVWLSDPKLPNTGIDIVCVDTSASMHNELPLGSVNTI